ncbi:hypothetical protein L210DRAFT_984361 [Boletus edulis BED1]|uniref:Uncharacterized protein n=1 Tax=Boletus edulis BED1 TaxID=1328754 RepID=A0AAD4BLD8_BOLED|nr:hypothetical protein L210DRAFT_984361 [Boletus edulis BED1]
MITAELFEEKKESIFEQPHKVFKHYAKEYRNSNNLTLTHGAKPKGKSNAQTTRQDGRKQTKTEERVTVCDQSELQEAAWDFLFSYHYQSTDESAEEDGLGGIDPRTDDEQQVNTKAKPVAKRKAPSKLPWITRRPAYRAELDGLRYIQMPDEEPKHEDKDVDMYEERDEENEWQFN